MPLLSDLTVRTLHPASYRFSARPMQAVTVREIMLEDHLIDFSRFKPSYREVVENDLLLFNDVVVALKVREITSVGIYHPQIASPESVTLDSFKLAYRAGNLAEATSILAGLIYRLNRRPSLPLSEVRAMPITLLTDEQVTNFLALIKTVHEIRTKAREREKLLRELIPAAIHKFYESALEKAEKGA